MDIKLKNNRKIRITILLAGLVVVTAVNLCLFPWLIRNAEKEQRKVQSSAENIDPTYLEALYKGAYALYAELHSQGTGNDTELFLPDSDDLDDYDYIGTWQGNFEESRSQIDYYAAGEGRSEENTSNPLNKVLELKNLDAEKWTSNYECIFVLHFDEDGMMSVDVKKYGDGTTGDPLMKGLMQADRNNEIRMFAKENGDTFVPVKNFDVVYGIPYDTVSFLYDDYFTSSYYLISKNGGNMLYFVSMLVIVCFTCIMCSKKIWKKADMPDYLPKWHNMELGVLGAILSFTLVGAYMDEVNLFPYSLEKGFANAIGWDVLAAGGELFVIFGIMMGTVLILYPVVDLGVKEYIREYSLIYQIFPWAKKKWDGFLEEVRHIDFEEKSNKVILKIVIVNFLILAMLMCMWMFGIIGLVGYSIGLFYLLRRQYEKVRKDYQVLMRATNRIAEGDLDTEITEDIGVFEPFKAELAQIQTGFKKAVDEEVKSQRMKSELITNVSHDLKTPLTAITTYVELLKKEDITEEERKSYIETLEKKSLRLKVLIEDLFEVSKASTNNITLNLMDVDVVNLMKQVSIEHEDKFAAMGLTLRWKVPDKKVILKLDNQKTYRIFENLFVNIQKYAMPDSRVYINVEEAGDNVVIILRNMSAVELSVQGEELTERFVRGDASRNTEGSGLGLAIARSFTEAQKGTFHIDVDGDLFKVVISWKSGIL